MMLKSTCQCVAMLAVAAVLAGCLGGTRTNDTDLQTIEHERLAELLADDDTVLVDPRTPEAYARGHLPGAVSIPLPNMQADDPRLNGAGTIVVYAGGWTDPLALAAGKRLLVFGYDDVVYYPGGLELWAKSGGQVVQTNPDQAGRPDSRR